MLGFTILQVAAAALFSLPFNDGPVPGVDGQAAFFDGFDSRVVVWRHGDGMSGTTKSPVEHSAGLFVYYSILILQI